MILLGDHNQLPPITQSVDLARTTHLDQSLFARLIRLGVPHVTLDAQGRCRPALAELFAWRYPGLTNLPHVCEDSQKDNDNEKDKDNEMMPMKGDLPLFAKANTCLRHVYQVIDVPDYQGEGETEPQPHHLQNRGEAEYVVAVYQYLRLCGVPATTITVLTPYKGQRELLRSLLHERCRKNPLFGMPKRVTTVDKYQGQQNDLILLSLVRTKTVGYLRDVRRMLVAVSRARLGLYVFCRSQLFQRCLEVRPIFDRLLKFPRTLQLVENEYYPTMRGEKDEVNAFEVGIDDDNNNEEEEEEEEKMNNK